VEIDSALLQELMGTDDHGSVDRTWLREQVENLDEGKRLQIRNLQNGVSLFPQDVGVGISQVVPVIVAALHSTSGVVAIEEPESNIHPAFQVVLADLFLTEAKANPNVLFLIETHSEHLMLRVMRRIRETNGQQIESGLPAVTPEDVAIHFVEPSEQGPTIHRIRIDEDGEFMDPWPRGFFPERMKEIYGDDL
jgi:predicted ATPase